MVERLGFCRRAVVVILIALARLEIPHFTTNYESIALVYTFCCWSQSIVILSQRRAWITSSMVLPDTSKTSPKLTSHTLP